MIGLPTALVVAVIAAVTAAPHTEPVLTVEAVTVNGSGCPGDSATVEPLPDGRSFRVTFGGYAARTGTGAEVTDFRKNCQFSFQVRRPEGLTYAVAEVGYSGFAHLEAGATAMERANFYFQGQSQTTWRTHTFAGPLSEAWQVTDTIEVEAMVFAPCAAERNLNLNTELRVLAGSVAPHADNLMIMNPVITLRLAVRWCS